MRLENFVGSDAAVLSLSGSGFAVSGGQLQAGNATAFTLTVGTATLASGQYADSSIPASRINTALAFFTQTPAPTASASHAALETLLYHNSSSLNGSEAAEAIHLSPTYDSIVHGNGGDDTIDGTGSNAFGNQLFGDAGDDSIIGTASNDAITGGAGRDTINAGAGADTVYIGSTSDAVAGEIIDGGDGYDFAVVSGAGSIDATGVTFSNFETLQLGQATLTIAQLASFKDLRGGTLTLASSGVLDMGAFTSTLSGINLAAGTNMLTLGTSNSSNNSNVPLTVNGSTGDDFVDGSKALYSVKLSGGAGNDHLVGGARDDTFFASVGADTIDGGGGNDLLYALGSLDISAMSIGNVEMLQYDQVWISPSQLASFSYISGGTITLTAGGTVDLADSIVEFSRLNLSDLGNRVILGSVYNGVIVQGGAGNDTVDGSSVPNARLVLYGNGGDDSLIGSGQSDTFYAGAGNDTFIGGAGKDTLIVLSSADISGITLNSIDSLLAGSFQVSMTSAQLSGFAEFNATTLTMTDGGTADLTGSADNFYGFQFSDLGGKLILGSTSTVGVTVRGGAGNDTVDGSGANFLLSLYGSVGTDSLTGGKLGDNFYTVSGQDVIDGRGGEDTLNAADNTDISGVSITNVEVLSFNKLKLQASQLGVFDKLVGTELTITDAGTADLTGSTDNVSIINLNDAGNTLLLGATSIYRMRLNGGAGNDSIDGSASTLAVDFYGSGGTNYLRGGTNADRFYGISGADSIDGGGGQDTFNLLGDGSHNFTGHDSIDGGGGQDTLVAANFSDISGVSVVNVEALVFYNELTLTSSQLGAFDTLAGYALTLSNGGVADMSGSADKFAILTLTDLGTNLTLGHTSDQKLTIYDGVGNDTIDASDATFTIDIYWKGGADSIKGGSGYERVVAADNADISAVSFSNIDTLLFNHLRAAASQLGALKEVAGTTLTLTSGGDADLSAAKTTVGTIVLSDTATHLTLGPTSDYQTVTILAGAGSDTIDGSRAAYRLVFNASAGDDSLIGGSGGDQFNTGPGHTTIDGGGGADSLRLTGNYADYMVSVSGQTLAVTDKVGGRNGTTTVSNVEFLQFADQTLSVPAAYLGQVYYNANNGHYYQFIRANLSWDDAATAASQMEYAGRQGYLVTVASATELDFLSLTFSRTNGWIGASDAIVEGRWQWVTGPEAGTTFYNEFAFSQPGFSLWDSPHLADAAKDHAVLAQAYNFLMSDHADGYLVEYGGILAPAASPSAEIVLPNNIRQGQIGVAQIDYSPGVTHPTEPGLLLLSARGLLLRDPLTGQYADSILVPVPAKDDGSVTHLNINVMMVGPPGQSVDATVSIADAGATIDWAAQKDALQPQGVDDATWSRIFDTFTSEVGGRVSTLTTALAADSAVLHAFGMSDLSGSAALAFELEQAGDFGSLAARGAVGSMGQGWATTADIALDVGADAVVLTGLADFTALLSLSGAAAARYTVSASVGRSVDLDGQLLGAAPPGAMRFSLQPGGVYAGAGGATLVKSAGGYLLTTADGTKLHFNLAGRFLDAQAAGGTSVTASYDGAGHMTGLVDSSGRALNFSWSAGHLSGISDSSGYAVELGYSGDGKHLVASAGAAGETAYSYAGNGDLVGIDRAGTAPSDSFTYDAQGRLATVAVGGTTAETYGYSHEGGYTLTDAAGVATSVQLLPGGLAGSITDAAGHTSRLTYDTTGHLTGVSGTDGSGADFHFDAAGRLTSVVAEDGSSMSFGYTGTGTQPASITDSSGATKLLTYDAQGHLTGAQWADGSTLHFTYDADGDISGYVNRRGQASSYDYDAGGHLVSATGTSAGATSYTYDLSGRLVSAISAGGTTALTYDAAGHVTKIAYPDGHALNYSYDDAGRRISMIDEHGRGQFYGYDSAGHLATIGDDSGVLVTYSYDAAGRLSGELNANGTSTSYGYDGNGRLAAVHNLDSTGHDASHAVYTYDAQGQRAAMDTQDGHWVYGYDSAGQLASAAFTSSNPDVPNRSIAYSYDASGNRTAVVENGVTTNYQSNNLNQYVSAGTETYHYDADGNLVSRTGTSGTTLYTYDTQDRLTSVTAPDGTVTSYEYNIFGDRSAVVHDGVRTELVDDPFGLGNTVEAYSAGGLVGSYLYGNGLAATAGAGGHLYYDIDGTGSVVGVTDGTGGEANSYAYDPFGNPLYEHETVANDFGFNGAFGITDDGNGLLNMRARDYDPSLGRFISEDPLWLTGDVQSLYRFAGNDPVSNVDPSGQNQFVAMIALAVIGAVIWEVTTSHDVDKVDAAKHNVEQQFTQAFYYTDGTPNFDKTADAIQDVPKAQVVVVKNQLFDRILEIPKAAGLLIYDGGLIVYQLGKFAFDELVDWVKGDAAHGNSAPAPVARSYGDPHLVTFDSLAYDFQAVGEFTLVKSTDVDFEIQVRQSAFTGSDSVSLNSAVAVRMGNTVVEFDGQPARLLINGNAYALADGAALALDGGTIFRNGAQYTIMDDFGNGALVGGAPYLSIVPFLGDAAAGHVEGLFGNADGNAANDLVLADGSISSTGVQALYGAFADTWRVTDATSLFTYADGQSTASFTDRSFPAHPTTIADLDPTVRAAAEQAAIDAGLTPGTVAFNNAVLDVAVTGNAGFATAAAGAQADAGQQEEPEEVTVNKAPTAIADTASTTSGHAVTVDVLANDSDPEDDALTLLGGTDPAGGAVSVVDGLLVFTPKAGYYGTTYITYRITDEADNKVSGFLAVDVDALPAIGAPSSALLQKGVETLATGLSITDADAAENDIYVVRVSAPAGTLSATASDGGAVIVGSATSQLTLTGTLEQINDALDTLTLIEASAQEDVLTLEVTDAHGGKSTATVSLTVNTAPQIVSDGGAATVTKSIAENSLVVATIAASDADTGDTLTFTIAGGADASRFVVDGTTGVLRFVTAADFEAPADADKDNIYNVVVSVSDGSASDTQTLAVQIGNVHGVTIKGTSAANLIDTTHAPAHQPYPTGEEDIIDGGKGADTMRGLGGNDIYVVDNAKDVVDETGGAGIDLVRSSVSFSLAGSQARGVVENLTLTGSKALTATGNAHANVLTGNSGANQLTGGAGSDILIGGRGRDLLSGNAAQRTSNDGERDFFRFLTAADSSTGTHKQDEIWGVFSGKSSFNPAGTTDVIDLSAIDTNGAAAGGTGDTRFKFVSSFSKTGSGEVRITHLKGHDYLVSIDTDRDSDAEMTLLVHSNGALGAGDLVL